MLKKILVVLAVVVAGFFAFAAAQPTLYRVQRSIKIEAPAPLVFAQLSDFKAWGAWSPWEGKDPAMEQNKKNYRGMEDEDEMEEAPAVLSAPISTGGTGSATGGTGNATGGSATGGSTTGGSATGVPCGTRSCRWVSSG